MPSKQVSELTCDRCKHTWYESTPDVANPTPKAQVAFVSGGEVVVQAKFDVLCRGCAKAVRTLLESVAKELGHKSPERKKVAKKKDAGPTADTTPSSPQASIKPAPRAP